VEYGKRAGGNGAFIVSWRPLPRRAAHSRAYGHGHVEERPWYQNGCVCHAQLIEALITEQTYYRWRMEYGGLQVDQARLKELEQENAKLKRLVVDLSLDKFKQSET
jgi:hypothetical protein